VTDGAGDGWRSDREAGPTVLIIGGFLSSPPVYARLRERLLRRGAAHVVVANIWMPNWLLIPIRGHGPVAVRAARALIEAGEVSKASRRSLGSPVLVVGHSAGGVIARILTSPVDFEGRRYAGAGRIGAIVTLGSPHEVTAGRANAGSASRFAQAHVPGAFFAPRVGYLTVASRARTGRRAGTVSERWRWRSYSGLLPAGAPDAIAGDGLIPVQSALLDGARQIVLDDIVHAQIGGRPWYGSDEGLDQWWEAAVDTWRMALDARRSAV
jgi:pimeloyl-ACP methyl ester carboxylesterase